MDYWWGQTGWEKDTYPLNYGTELLPSLEIDVIISQSPSFTRGGCIFLPFTIYVISVAVGNLRLLSKYYLVFFSSKSTLPLYRISQILGKNHRVILDITIFNKLKQHDKYVGVTAIKLKSLYEVQKLTGIYIRNC